MARLITVGNKKWRNARPSLFQIIRLNRIEPARPFFGSIEKSNQRKRGKPPQPPCQKRSRELSTVVQANNTCKRRWPEREEEKWTHHFGCCCRCRWVFVYFVWTEEKGKRKESGEKKSSRESCLYRRRPTPIYIYTWCAPYKDKYHALAFKKIQTDLFFFFLILEIFWKYTDWREFLNRFKLTYSCSSKIDG